MEPESYWDIINEDEAYQSSYKNMSKKWYESRTLWLSIVTGIAGVLVILQTSHPEWGYVIILKAFLDGILRYNTITTIK